MKQIIALSFLILMTFSCVSGGDKGLLDDLRDELRQIERQAKNGDVEEMIEEFRSHLEEAGKELSDLELADEGPIDWNWVDSLKTEGWENELKRQAELFFKELKSIDSKDLKRYGREIKKYAKKLEKNIFETAVIVGDFIKEKAEEFSASDFVKALTEIWKE